MIQILTKEIYFGIRWLQLIWFRIHISLFSFKIWKLNGKKSQKCFVKISDEFVIEFDYSVCLIFQIPVMAMSHMIIETASKVVCSWANKNNKSWWYFLIWVVLVGLEGKSPFVIVIVCWAPDPQFFQVFEAEKVDLVSKELNHLAAILHVYAGGLNFMK